MALEMWNGSVWVTMTVGTSPMPRVSGATLAAISTASRRPVTSSVRDDWTEKPSSMVTKSSSPRCGLGDDVGPVPGGEQLPRPGPRLAPRGGMPARAIQGDRQVHGCLRSARAGPRPGRRLDAPAAAARVASPF